MYHGVDDLSRKKMKLFCDLDDCGASCCPEVNVLGDTGIFEPLIASLLC
jgi:hypothetical protein